MHFFLSSADHAIDRFILSHDSWSLDEIPRRRMEFAQQLYLLKSHVFDLRK